MTGYYGRTLPQLGGRIFLTDGGLETSLIYHAGIDLPSFAAFTLLNNQAGRDTLATYYERYIAIARRKHFGFILESPTWRASKDWTDKLGYSEDAMIQFNRHAIALMATLKANHASAVSPMVVSGCIGPRGDGYQPTSLMGNREAEDYHALQAEVFADAGADMVTAITMNYAEEAIGIARAAVMADIPVAISFTVETDGRLPTGQSLSDAVAMVDGHTGSAPAYYMVNCAHPTHFADILKSDAVLASRLRGVRANASRSSHAELDTNTALDDGDPLEFGAAYGDLLQHLPHLTVLGGCCGTDHRHVDEVARQAAIVSSARSAVAG